MILAVLGIGFVLGLMIRPARYLGSMSVTLAAGFLLAAVLHAVFRRGQEREFWFGFAIVGWGYFILVFAEPFRVEVGHELLTTKLLVWLSDDPRLQVSRIGHDLDFLRYGQSILTMFIALLGGAAARHWFASRRRAEDSRREPAATRNE